MAQEPKSQIEKRVDALAEKVASGNLSQFYQSVTDPTLDPNNDVKEGAYWLQIDSTSTKNAVSLKHYETVSGTLTWVIVANCNSGGSGTTINYAIMIQRTN